MFLKSVDDAVTEVLFVNSLKGLKMDEDKINFKQETSALLGKCIQQLREYFEGTRKQFELPINQDGTDFQKKVWEKLLHIPFGSTISYRELSRRIENVKAIRAVGTCNGRNRLSIIVPCHRVIGSNGDLTGYGGDLWRKKWLLDHEAKYARGVRELF